jgi:alkaline phosphatase
MNARLTTQIFTLILTLITVSATDAQTSLRIMPPDGSVLAVGQRFDIRVEATAANGQSSPALRVWANGRDLTSRSDPLAGRGAPNGSASFLFRGFSVNEPGPLVVRAETTDGVSAEVRLTVEMWNRPRRGAARARNIIFLVGDGMGIAHRTAARIVSRGVRNGKAAGRLAMDTLDVTGLVMTASLNSVITDSSPGMAAYVTGQKSNNNQQGVYPDNTGDAFDNPRVEYLGELLRRHRGPGFHVGLVTTADVTDSTPAANAVHTADRSAGASIAAQFFDERARNGVTVLLGGGSRHFVPKAAGGTRPDDRNLADEYVRAGYARVHNAGDVRTLLAAEAAPPALLGLFHPSHLPVAFDKVGAGSYSAELALEVNAQYRDTPMLEDLTRLALRSLESHSPEGFYLMVEGASIDKRAHAADAERTVWDTIEFDRAVQVALDFARRTNSDRSPLNDTLVVVTADHESGGLAIIGVGNERYRPAILGRAVRDYAAVFRFDPEQQLPFVPNYAVDARGFPIDPDPSRKLLLGWAAAPDRFENWTADRVMTEAAVIEARESGLRVTVANPARGQEVPPGFLVPGIIENGATPCPAADGCPGDTASGGFTAAGHTATDVPLSATGPGAWQFTGVYENTDVFLKLLRASTGSDADAGAARR